MVNEPLVFELSRPWRVTATVALWVVHYLFLYFLIDELINRNTYNTDAYEDDNEQSATNCVYIDVTIAHSWHGNNEEIQTLPKCDGPFVGKVEEHITRVFQLKW